MCAVAQVMSAADAPTRSRAWPSAASPYASTSVDASVRAVSASPSATAPSAIMSCSRIVRAGSAAAVRIAGRTASPRPARPASANIRPSRVESGEGADARRRYAPVPSAIHRVRGHDGDHRRGLEVVARIRQDGEPAVVRLVAVGQERPDLRASRRRIRTRGAGSTGRSRPPGRARGGRHRQRRAPRAARGTDRRSASEMTTVVRPSPPLERSGRRQLDVGRPRRRQASRDHVERPDQRVRALRGPAAGRRRDRDGVAARLEGGQRHGRRSRRRSTRSGPSRGPGSAPSAGS